MKLTRVLVAALFVLIPYIFTGPQVAADRHHSDDGRLEEPLHHGGRSRRGLLTILPVVFKIAATVATTIKKLSDKNEVAAALEDVNQKLSQISGQLNSLSADMEDIKHRLEQNAQLGRLASIFGSSMERLFFFTNVNIMAMSESRRLAWADAVLSHSDDGMGQVLSNLNNMILGRNIFGTKSIMIVFIDSIPNTDARLWDKVNKFADVLKEMQAAGFSTWAFAAGIKGLETEVMRVSTLATKRQSEQDLAVFGPLKADSLIQWPEGSFGIPRVKNTGCPTGSWATGSRYHDTEDDNSDNKWSNPLHLDGSWGKNNMQWNFCIKTTSTNGGAWPAGKYCVFSNSNNCLSGMREGYIKWDDEDDKNKNSVSGVLPKGEYNRNTLIYFCCMEKGNVNTEIRLPVQKPFFLFPLEGQGCQKVHKMTAREEFFQWDCEDDDNANMRRSPHPKETQTGRNIGLAMCYYERVRNY